MPRSRCAETRAICSRRDPDIRTEESGPLRGVDVQDCCAVIGCNVQNTTQEPGGGPNCKYQSTMVASPGGWIL